jgi:hypothetical protein
MLSSGDAPFLPTLRASRCRNSAFIIEVEGPLFLNRQGLHDFQFFGRSRGDPGIPVLGGTEYDASSPARSLNGCSRGETRAFARIALYRQ